MHKQQNISRQVIDYQSFKKYIKIWMRQWIRLPDFIRLKFFWNDSGMTLEWLWNDSGMTLEGLWNNIGTTLEQLCNNSGTTVEPDHFWKFSASAERLRSKCNFLLRRIELAAEADNQHAFTFGLCPLYLSRSVNSARFLSERDQLPVPK